jgi:alanyl-tRNA synthetase
MQISEKEWKELKRKEKILNQAAEVLRVEPKDLPRVIKRFQDEIKEMDQKLQS